MDPEEDPWMINEGRDTRNLHGDGASNKRWNKKEMAKRGEQLEKRRLQAEGKSIEVEEPQVEKPVKEKLYTNGKAKKEQREPSPVLMEEPRAVRSNKKMERNMRRE